MKLDLEQEPFPAAGGIDGRAARRAMGKPDIAFWDLFLRETLQNSWDAKIETSSSISFAIDAVTLTADQNRTLREVLEDVPPSLVQSVGRWKANPARALLITDKGTRGLGGVTRADKAAEPDQSRDYVDFLRNVGRAATKTLGGGTYGFGKGVLYDASGVDTCLVYSQTLIDGALVNRFIVSCVGEQHEQYGMRLTGRNWWGVAGSDGVVEPLSGAQARSLAVQLGLDKMSPTETGTVIAVLEPRLAPEDSARSIVEQLCQAARHWAWPHMVDVGTGPTINFAFSADGIDVPIKHPSDDPVLQHFVRAYEKAVPALAAGKEETPWPWTVKPVELLRPFARLGILTYRKYSLGEGTSDSDLTRHIALMRTPRFVVKYLPVSEDPAGQAIAGVFIVTPELNDVFAKSEPVAHDDWVPDGGRSNPVKVALSRLLGEFKNLAPTKASAVGNEHASGVAQISRMLGSVLAGVSGPGGEVHKRAISPGGGGGGSKAGFAVSLASDPRLLLHAGQIYSDFHFAVRAGPNEKASDYVVRGSAKVVLDGGTVENTQDVPSGADLPAVAGWFADGKLIGNSEEIEADLLVGSWFVLRLKQPPGTAITAVIDVSRRS